jgi:hypothetical protein
VKEEKLVTVQGNISWRLTGETEVSQYSFRGSKDYEPVQVRTESVPHKSQKLG